MRCGSSFTASGAGCRATCSRLWARLRTSRFPEAVRIVAQKCGIPLPKQEFSSPEQAAEARLRGKLLDLHEAATAWFEEQLRGPEGALAREYLAGRGLDRTRESAKFRIGYAPDSFNAPARPAEAAWRTRRRCGRAGCSAQRSRATVRRGRSTTGSASG